MKQLQGEIASIQEAVKDEQLEKANEAIALLNQMGFPYRLVMGEARRAGNERTRQRHVDPNKACPICQFTTSPPHDGRAHRSQKVKQPFTADKLADLGLTRV